MEQHVRDDLSAYLDGALPPAERALVQGHLDGCAACRTAVAELTATARVIAALPLAAPSRRLVPSLAPRLAWLRPARSLSAVLSGMFILVFMASATLDTGWRMGGGRAGVGGTATTAARAQPARELGPVLQATDSVGRSQPAAASSPNAAAQEAVRSPGFGGPAASGGVRADAARAADAAPASAQPLRIGPSPWLWLGLALLSGMLALAAHRRSRAR